MTFLTGMILRHEGMVLHAYQDSLGYWTIGVGRLIDKRKGGGISEDEAMYMLRNDISRCMVEVRRALPFFDTLLDIRQDVLINMVFNLGITKFLKFKKMIKALKERDYDEASKQMIDSKWAKQVGKRAIELAQIMKTGKEVI